MPVVRSRLLLVSAVTLGAWPFLDDPDADAPRCELCRAQEADGVFDGQPRCVECADHELALAEAIARDPSIRERIPTPDELRKMGREFWPDWS